MAAPESRSRQPKQLDAGDFQPEISSFRLHLAAEGKAAKTVRTYTEAVQWFAAARLRPGEWPHRLGGGPEARTCRSGSSGCWAGTAPRTPATSSAPCSSSSSGSPPRRKSRTRWPG